MRGSTGAKKLITQYHTVWIQYYKDDTPFWKRKGDKEKDPLFRLYSEKEIDSGLKGCKSEVDVTEKLAQIFGFPRFPFSKMIEMIESTDEDKADDIQYGLFRGFIAALYIIEKMAELNKPTAMPSALKDIDRVVAWIASQESMKREFLIVLEPVLGVMRRPNKGHCLYPFFMSTMNGIIANMKAVYDHNLWYAHDYVVNRLTKYYRESTLVDETDPLLLMFRAYVMSTAPYVGANTRRERQKLIADMVLVFFRRCDVPVENIEEDMSRNEAILSAYILKKFSGTEGAVVSAVFALVKWLRGYMSNEISRDIPLDATEQEESLVVQTAEEYRDSHLFLYDWRQIMSPSMREMADRLRPLFKNIVAHPLFCVTLDECQKDLDDQWLIIILSCIKDYVSVLGEKVFHIIQSIMNRCDEFMDDRDDCVYTCLKHAALHILRLLFDDSPGHRSTVVKFIGRVKTLHRIFVFLPMFRCLLVGASQDSFVSEICESNLFDGMSQVLSGEIIPTHADQFMAFIQQIVISKTAVSFECNAIVLLLGKAMSIPRYEELSLYCFKLGCELVRTERTGAIITEMVSAMYQAEGHSSACVIGGLIDVITEVIPTFSRAHAQNIPLAELFEVAALVPVKTHRGDTMTSVLKCVKAVTESMMIRHGAAKILENSKCYSHLARGFEEIPLTLEAVELMMEIRTVGCYKVLINAVKGSDVEDKFLDLVIKNCGVEPDEYAYFEAGIMSYALDRVKEPLLSERALKVYGLIGQKFFSLGSLRQFAVSMANEGKKVEKLKSLREMIENDSPQFSSFFHFHDRLKCGIFGPETRKMGDNWIYRMSLKLDNATCQLLEVTDGAGTRLEFRLDDGSLSVIYDACEERFKHLFVYEFKPGVITKLLISVSQKSIQLYVNDKLRENYTLTRKLKFTESRMVKIAHGLVGDFGPVAIMSSTDLAYHSSDMSTVETDDKCIAAYHPRNCVDDVVENVHEGADAKIIGVGVPYSTNALEIMQSEGSCRSVVSMFYLIDSEEMYTELMKVFMNSMESLHFEKELERVGGFRLLSGICYGSPHIGEHIIRLIPIMFSRLRLKRLRIQLVEFILLNFGFFAGASAENQCMLYSAILTDLISSNPLSFSFSDLAFVINQVQEPCDEANQCVKRAQFGVLQKLLELGMSDKDMDLLLFVIEFSPDSFIRGCCIDACRSVFSNDTRVNTGQRQSFMRKATQHISALDDKTIENIIELTESMLRVQRMVNHNNLLLPTVGFMKECSSKTVECLLSQLCGGKDIETCTSLERCEYLPLVLASLRRANEEQKSKLSELIMETIAERPEFIIGGMHHPLLIFALAVQNASCKMSAFVTLCLTKMSLLPIFMNVYHAYGLFARKDVTTWQKELVFGILTSDDLKAADYTKVLREAIRLVFLRNVVEGEDTITEPVIPLDADHVSEFLNYMMTSIGMDKTGEETNLEIVESYDFELMKKLWSALLKTAENRTEETLEVYTGMHMQVQKVLTLSFYLLIKYCNSTEDEVISKTVDILNRLYSDDEECLSLLKSVSGEGEFSTELYDRFKNGVSTTEICRAGKDTIKRGMFDIKEAFCLEDITPTEQMYKDFVHDAQESVAFVKCYSHKLMVEFRADISDVTIGENVKWHMMSRVDFHGRQLFMRINNKFDDHKKAAALRDSGDFTEEAEETVSIKHVADQSVFFSKARARTLSVVGIAATLVTVKGQYNGTISSSNGALVFAGMRECDGLGGKIRDDEMDRVMLNIKMKEIEFVFNRTRIFADTFCEIFTVKCKSYFFDMGTVGNRSRLYKMIPRLPKDTPEPNRYNFFATLRVRCGSLVQNVKISELLAKSNVTKAWTTGQISTFEYLMYLNILSNRSMNDIAQYPVFPWVLSDFTSDVLDLSDPSVYRDMSKPVGAIGATRLEELEASLRDCEEMGLDETEKCLYRSHYSSPAVVAGFLIRMEPFTTLHVLLQGGKFDQADRLFCCLKTTWTQVTSCPNDFRELIPQFYCMDSFLCNENGYNLGKSLHTGRVANDCELPCWAKSSFEFVQRHRQALESDHVREHLPAWIDLIFGCHQRSYEKKNVYHAFSYNDGIEGITDAVTIDVARRYNENFGTCPTKLFTIPHPKGKPHAKHTQLAVARAHSTEFLLFDRGVIIERDGQCVNVMTGERWALRFDGSSLKSSAWVSRTKQLVQLTRSGGCAKVYSVDLAPQVLIQGAAVIQCMSVSGHNIMTVSSDELLRFWTLPDLRLIGTVGIQCDKIVGISSDHVLDIVALIDTTHHIVTYFISERTHWLSFKVDCDENARHQIVLLRNGIIAVSCQKESSTDSSFVIKFYTMRGKYMGEQAFSGRLVKMSGMHTHLSEHFLIVMTSSRAVTVIDCTTFSVLKTFTERPRRNLVMRGTGRSLVFGLSDDTPCADQRLALVEF